MSDDDLARIQHDFERWLAGSTHSQQLAQTGVVLKAGPKVVKTVTAYRFGNRTTGTVGSRKLQFRTHRRRADGSCDFADVTDRWYCENAEVDAFLAFLHGRVAVDADRRVLAENSPVVTALGLLVGRDVDVEHLFETLLDLGDGKLGEALASTRQGVDLAHAAVLQDRRRLLGELRAQIADPGCTETDVQRLIENQHWVFGGRYVGVAPRRSITALDQYDIPLLCADGSLHLVELKGPVIPKLVRLHRNHWIAGEPVHEAVMQAVNYVRALDEEGPGLTTKLRSELDQDWDLRRVFATVVVGSLGHVARGPTELQVRQALRSYNAHLTRVHVVTWTDLVDEAEQALTFAPRQEGPRTLTA